MAEHTMEELLRAPTEGYGEAIVLPEINADHFEIKTNLLQLVQANPFHGLENENPHAHINSFKRITSTLRFRNVPNDASVCATTGTYNQVNPPNRVSNQMAPPGFAPVQNNGQNRFNQNQVQGNNFNRGNNFHGNQGFQAQNNHAPNFQNQGFQNQPFQVPNNQVQQEISNDFSSYKRNNDQMLRNMQNQINSLKGDLKNEIQNTIKSQQAVMMNQQTTFQNNLQNMICGLFQNQASTSGTLPSNTIPNPKGEMKAITTRSGVAYEGPSIPTNPSPKKVVERETEETTDKEQTNFQGSTAQIPPPVIPISIPEPDVLKTLPKTTPILESDIPKSLPKPNIPYPSRRDDQKSCDKASNQMEKIFQIFQDLRFDISFADALLLMPRFAPTIKSLLMNKEKLLELAKIPLNENCSAMLLKKLPEKLRDPGKFLIPCNFSGMDVCHALADLGASINLMPLSIWKKLSLPELTPTRMTLELADRLITLPKGVAEDIFVKVGNFHFPTNFVVVDFEADPRVPLILGRSFLRTSRALIDVYEGKLVLRDGNEQITFHVDGTSKHPQKHVNKSIKMVNDTCKDSFEGFADRPTLVCLTPSEDGDNEQEVKNLAEPTAKRQTRITPYLKNLKVIQKESIFHSNKTPQVSLVFAITSTLPSIEPKDYLIMGDEHLSTFSVEEIVPIPRESEDTITSIEPKDSLIMGDEHFSTSRVEEIVPIPRKSWGGGGKGGEYKFFLFNNDKGCDLTSCDDNMIFSNPLLYSKDDLTSSNDDSILKKDIQEEDFRIYSNPLFEFGDNFNSSNENPLFNEMEEDVENENSKVFDEPVLPHTPFSDKEGYYDSKGDVIFLESLLSDDTTHNLSPEVFFDHEPQQNESNHNTSITFSPRNDPLYHEFVGEIITNPSRIAREHEEYLSLMTLLCEISISWSPENFHASPSSIIESPFHISFPVEDRYYDSEGDVIFLENLLNDDTTHNLSPKVFFDHEPQQIRNEPENESLKTFSPKSAPLHHEFAGEVIIIPPRIVREHEDYISLMLLLCGNSSSQSSENPHTVIESLLTSTTLVEDSDSHREEIDIFSGLDDSTPPGIESDVESEGDVIVRNNLFNDDISLPEYERLTFDIEPNAAMINNIDELNEYECFDPEGGEINVEVYNSFTFFIRNFLPYLTYPEDSPLLLSTGSEDTIFDAGIST
ncbi:reverse transcriptase domain-containing protein [Tanacetum coccineum]|uniref:Reverse transcriptase domain-containing protein n=1 Tax=Tanacetum coccineum TaxID=301880 RepID=A0ABQ5CYE9_9ASTR